MKLSDYLFVCTCLLMHACSGPTEGVQTTADIAQAQTSLLRQLSEDPCEMPDTKLVRCDADCNRDGVLNTADPKCLQDYIVDKKDTRNRVKLDEFTYDFNANGQLTILDAFVLNSYIISGGAPEKIGHCDCLENMDYADNHRCSKNYVERQAVRYDAYGEGSKDNPYRIFSAKQIESMSKESAALDKHYLQCHEISFEKFYGKDSPYFNIGSFETPFTGSYDGNGFKISHFTYDDQGPYYVKPSDKWINIGLFGHVKNGSLTNIKLEKVNIRFTQPNEYGARVASLAGSIDSSTVKKAYATGEVAGTERSFVGGLIGEVSEGSQVEYAHAHVRVNGGNSVAGGLVGSVDDSHVFFSYATGKISGNQSVGGLVGSASGGRISFSYATGDVESGDSGSAGGFAGSIHFGAKLSDVYAYGSKVSSTGIENGGLVGDCIYASINNAYSYNFGVFGKNYNGAIVGHLQAFPLPGGEASLTNSFSVQDSKIEYESIIGYYNYSAVIQNNHFHFKNCPDCTSYFGTGHRDVSYFYSQANAPMNTWNFAPHAWVYKTGNELPTIPTAGYNQ